MTASASKFSLVLGTVGRTTEVERFLATLDQQTHRDFELIVIDQNPDDRLRAVLDRHEGRFPMRHLRCAPGLSRARNVGLQHVTGDIVTFPDDDCWYAPDLLERVARFLGEHPEYDGLAGRPVDDAGKTAVGRFELRAGLISRLNVWRRSTSIGLFLRRRLVDAVGGFDETLGAGAGTPWGAAEDIDYPLRALASGSCLYYDPAVTVGHPNPMAVNSDRCQERAYSYGAGMGRVLRKHRYPLWFVVYQWVRPFGGGLLALLRINPKRARNHWGAMKGRIDGWRTAP